MAEIYSTEVLDRALEGARICEAHWQAEGDAELLADAQARTQRILAGTACEEDILGALDWLD